MSRAQPKMHRIALVGNPNCGKTALFNLLTGSRQKVANYAGVTVERKEGLCPIDSQTSVQILDLPGAYSLDSTSPDEAVTRDVLRGEYRGEPQPEAIICVVDATNLRLHLRFALELTVLGLPMIVAVNMMDSARRQGLHIDIASLSEEMGMPVVETIAVQQQGAMALREQLQQQAWVTCATRLPRSRSALSTSANDIGSLRYPYTATSQFR
ncbi:FeoB small GTPase domain-containing protein [Zhongshania aliphaticivorans]|uniref:FeoB small GTPase domain-containing protein n=1 Tax=Zhongshania aliphaticivorans TaxID=1470434 RepID=UPI0012E40FD3|nr:FeoB small GTPase domain-containing protein [Zhongshania aliphaticivorans]CAA0115694.1 Fe(2+) transporter FeoB [Zhongshania aliphaticivorans]